MDDRVTSLGWRRDVNVSRCRAGCDAGKALDALRTNPRRVIFICNLLRPIEGTRCPSPLGKLADPHLAMKRMDASVSRLLNCKITGCVIETIGKNKEREK